MGRTKYLGDNRLRHWVEFQRDSNMQCIYCGKIADSREHVPSRAFLSTPYPDDLPTLPACKKCNNSFSSDERFVSLLIKTLKQFHINGDISKEDIGELYLTKEGKLAFELAKSLDYKTIAKNESLKRILLKLAKGHMVYELTEGYGQDFGYVNLMNITIKFAPEMSEDEIEEMDDFLYIGDRLLPEVGSRVYENILVLEQISSDGNQNKSINIPVLNWTDIQDQKYRYRCYWNETSDAYFVDIVINEFFYAHLLFSEI